MRSTSGVWILIMNVALFFSLPAMANVLNASLEMTSGAYRGTEMSVSKLHRCTSLSSEVCSEAAVSAFLKQRNPTIYTAAHSKLGGYYREQRLSQNKQFAKHIQLRGTKQGDGECTGSGDTNMYTRIQTQLYPHIPF